MATRKLIYCETRAKFDAALADGTLTDQIVRIGDTGEVWVNGEFYTPEAPRDGKMYARQDGTWVQVNPVQALGRYTTSTVPKNSIVSFAGHTFIATADTTEAPYPCITDQDGNRLLQTQDGGTTYGYIVADTSTVNTGWMQLS